MLVIFTQTWTHNQWLYWSNRSLSPHKDPPPQGLGTHQLHTWRSNSFWRSSPPSRSWPDSSCSLCLCLSYPQSAPACPCFVKPHRTSSLWGKWMPYRITPRCALKIYRWTASCQTNTRRSQGRCRSGSCSAISRTIQFLCQIGPRCSLIWWSIHPCLFQDLRKRQWSLKFCPPLLTGI